MKCTPSTAPPWTPTSTIAGHNITVTMSAAIMDFFDIHEDQSPPQSYDIAAEDRSDLFEEPNDPDNDPPSDQETELSVPSDSDSDAGSEVDDAVAEDIEKFTNTFKGISTRFRLINRIGEGTFSTVYKAEDLYYDVYHNDWDLDPPEREASKWSSPPLKKRRTGDGATSMSRPSGRKPQYVAIKKIYVTSSPNRIQNELELLYDLRGCDSVCPLITAFRHQDQVVAVLPYFRHVDFRVRTFSHLCCKCGS